MQYARILSCFLLVAVLETSAATPSYTRQAADFSLPASTLQWNVSLKQGMQGYLLPFDFVNGTSGGTNVPLDLTGWQAVLKMRRTAGLDAASLTGTVSTTSASFELTSAFLATPVSGWSLILVVSQGSNIVNQAGGLISIEPSPELDAGVLATTRGINIGQYSWAGVFSPSNIPAVTAVSDWDTMLNKPSTFPPDTDTTALENYYTQTAADLLLASKVATNDAAYLASLTNVTGSGGIAIAGTGRNIDIDGSEFVQTNHTGDVSVGGRLSAGDAAKTNIFMGISGFVGGNAW